MFTVVHVSLLLETEIQFLIGSWFIVKVTEYEPQSLCCVLNERSIFNRNGYLKLSNTNIHDKELVLDCYKAILGKQTKMY